MRQSYFLMQTSGTEFFYVEGASAVHPLSVAKVPPPAACLLLCSFSLSPHILEFFLLLLWVLSQMLI